MFKIKHLCQSCQTKFYNSSNIEITCPACGVAISEVNINLKEKDISLNENEGYLSEENEEFFSEETEDPDELYILNKDYDYQ